MRNKKVQCSDVGEAAFLPGIEKNENMNIVSQQSPSLDIRTKHLGSNSKRGVRASNYKAIFAAVVVIIHERDTLISGIPREEMTNGCGNPMGNEGQRKSNIQRVLSLNSLTLYV